MLDKTRTGLVPPAPRRFSRCHDRGGGGDGFLMSPFCGGPCVGSQQAPSASLFHTAVPKTRFGKQHWGCVEKSEKFKFFTANATPHLTLLVSRFTMEARVAALIERSSAAALPLLSLPLCSIDVMCFSALSFAVSHCASLNHVPADEGGRFCESRIHSPRHQPLPVHSYSSLPCLHGRVYF